MSVLIHVDLYSTPNAYNFNSAYAEVSKDTFKMYAVLDFIQCEKLNKFSPSAHQLVIVLLFIKRTKKLRNRLLISTFLASNFYFFKIEKKN